MILSLDLSLSCTGYSVINKDGKIDMIEEIIPKSKLSHLYKWKVIIDKIGEVYPLVKDVVIEDTFQGPNATTRHVLDRLAGAVAYSWFEYSKKEPIFYTASRWRTLAGLSPKVQKIDTQIWLIENYFPKFDIKQFKKKYNDLRKQYVLRKFTLKQLNDELRKVSIELGKDTGITNDKADSAVLGIAHYNYLKKDNK